MKKLLLLLAFSLPLLAQDVYDTPEEVDKEITKQEQQAIAKECMDVMMAVVKMVWKF